MKKRTVLFVDDEINVLASLKRGLIEEDYRCVFTESPKKALEILEKEQIAVIVTDMRMPEMDGLTLLKKVKEKYPNTVRVVLSGYTQIQQMLLTINQGDIFKFITKPWKIEDEFKPVIKQAIEYYNLINAKEEFNKALEIKNAAIQNILKDMDKKLANSKKEFEETRNFMSTVFDIILKDVIKMDTQNNMEVRLDCVRRFCMGYMNTIPSEIKEFEIGLLLEELIAQLSSIGNFEGIIQNPRKIEETICLGNFKLSFFTALYVLNYVALLNPMNQMVIGINLKKDSINAKVEIVANIKGSDKSNTNANKKIDISFIERLVNELINESGISITIQNLDNGIFIRHQSLFMLKVNS